MVFQRKGRKVYFFKLTRPDTGESATLSCRTEDFETAKDVEAVCKRYVGRRRWDVVGLLLAKRMDPGKLYDADADGTVEAFVAEHLAAEQDRANTPADLRHEAVKWGAEEGHADYARQLAVLYPDDQPLTVATFTRKEVVARLKTLPVQRPTKNRYKAAASSFANHLVDAELLEFNFVRTIKGFKENPARVVYYTHDDAKTLIGALAQPYAGAAAFALAFGAEWCAIRDLEVGDLRLTENPVTARVRGAKREWRDRTVPLVPQLAWTLTYLTPLLKDKTPAVRVFAGLREWELLRAQQATAKARKIVAQGEAKFSPHDLHDWRHTHAVILLRAGYDEQIAAAHLGHKNTDLIRKRYGIYVPDRFDYAKQARPDKSETSPRKHMKRGGVT